MFPHRTTVDGEIHYVTNRKSRPKVFEATFRVAGKMPEIWRAETGEVEAATWRAMNGTTQVSLDMASNDAFFHGVP